MAIINHTTNGEITFNTATKQYTVWDEVYLDAVCVTNYPLIAEAALQIYCKDYLGFEVGQTEGEL